MGGRLRVVRLRSPPRPDRWCSRAVSGCRYHVSAAVGLMCSVARHRWARRLSRRLDRRTHWANRVHARKQRASDRTVATSQAPIGCGIVWDGAALPNDEPPTSRPRIVASPFCFAATHTSRCHSGPSTPGAPGDRRAQGHSEPFPALVRRHVAGCHDRRDVSRLSRGCDPCERHAECQHAKQRGSNG